MGDGNVSCLEAFLKAIILSGFQYDMGGGEGSGFLATGQLGLTGNKKVYVTIGQGRSGRNKNGGDTSVSNSDGDEERLSLERFLYCSDLRYFLNKYFPLRARTR